MKKSKKTLLLIVIAMLIILGTISTAFAAGETLYHSGSSRYAYVTTNDVPQRYDNHLKCTSASKNPSQYDMGCDAVIYDGGWEVVSSPWSYVWDFVTNTIIYIPDSTSGVRDVHIRIMNDTETYGKISVQTTGYWVLQQ